MSCEKRQLSPKRHRPSAKGKHSSVLDARASLRSCSAAPARLSRAPLAAHPYCTMMQCQDAKRIRRCHSVCKVQKHAQWLSSFSSMMSGDSCGLLQPSDHTAGDRTTWHMINASCEDQQTQTGLLLLAPALLVRSLGFVMVPRIWLCCGIDCRSHFRGCRAADHCLHDYPGTSSADKLRPDGRQAAGHDCNWCSARCLLQPECVDQCGVAAALGMNAVIYAQ